MFLTCLIFSWKKIGSLFFTRMCGKKRISAKQLVINHMFRTRTCEHVSKEQNIYLKTICFFIFRHKNISKEKQARNSENNVKQENENDLSEMEFYDGDIKKELPISPFEEIEAELCDRLLHSSSPKEDDETDRAIEFIKNIVDKVKEEFEGLIEDRNQKEILNTLTKIFTILLSVKADNAEKIFKIVKLTVSTVLKLWSEQS